MVLALVACDGPRSDARDGGADAFVVDGATPDGSVADASVADASTADAGSDAGASEVWLGNAPRDCAPRIIFAPGLPADVGRFVAAVLTPETTPVTVTRIGYSVLGNADVCRGGTAHRVLVYRSADGLPGATDEEAVAIVDVPETASRLGFRRYEHALDVPITLEEGETLVVAVSMSVDAAGTGAICLAACGDDAASGESLLSDVAVAPRAWSDLFDAGLLDAHLVVWAAGPE